MLAASRRHPRRRHDGRHPRPGARRPRASARHGLHDGMGFTYRNPERSTDPRRAVDGATSVIVAARPYLTDATRRRRAGPGRTRGSAATPGSTTTPRCARACATAEADPAAGHRAVAFADDNSSSTGRSPPGRARLVRQERQPAAAGRGQLLRARVDRHHRRVRPRPSRSHDGCGTCDECSTVPDRRDRRPGGDRRATVPELGAAEAGPIPLEFRERDRRPDLRLRRLPGRVPDLGAARQAQHVPLPDDARRGSTRSTCSTPTTTGSSAVRQLVHRRPRLRLAAPQRARRRSATSAIPTIARVRAVVERYRSARRPILAEHADWAPTDSTNESDADPADTVKHLLVTNDYPPKIGGIQSLLWEWWKRLPADRSPC